MQIVKQLKGEYSFYKSIYTLQRYYKAENENPKRHKKPFKRKYYFKWSTSRKPYFSKDKHIWKFDTNRDYKNKLSCFTCGSTDHLIRDSIKKKLP